MILAKSGVGFTINDANANKTKKKGDRRRPKLTLVPKNLITNY